MKRHSKGSAFDISIHRDELEHNRRQLESRLKSNISAIPAPPEASDEDDEYNNNSSVEYPRHDSGPMPYPDFPSFAHRSREEDSHIQMGWSYRTGDDEDGINPYGGETMSTVAHHASALTITAGLGGGRGARRDVSMSGAEYDPDRPLNQIMAGVGRMSMFDEKSTNKTTANNITFEPLVVDSTAELDRILQSGFAPGHPTPPMSRASSSTSTSDSEPGSPSRPKLSDHLRTLAFSPKRPRSAQPVISSPHHAQQASPLAKRNKGSSSVLSSNNNSLSMATPRPTRRVVSSAQTPEVRLQPPTPSTASSKFTRMARGITKELADTQDAAAANARPKRAAPAMHEQSPMQARIMQHRKRDQSKSRIVLPDVTGLTAAVESPARLGKEYHPYKGGASREAEARLLQTLGQVQSKLQQLNEENGISRRRVRELEMELDDCKMDVARERTRLLEKEEVIAQQQKEMLTNRAKGKAKARDTTEDPEDVTKRYKDAVEEKKALEALINSLRSHLTRLTSELASHQELLQELRELRETDSRTLREKTGDISRLKDEVERLAGEVEVLRGVVEEGLRERRAGKEATLQHQSQADIGMSQDLDDESDGSENEEEEQEEEEEEAELAPRPRRPFPTVETDSEDEADDDYQPPSFSLAHSSFSRPVDRDRTSRTDLATLGSSNVTATPHRVQFIDQREMEQIAAEVEERRSDRSFNESFNPVGVERRERSRSPIARPRTPVPASTPTPPPPPAAAASRPAARHGQGQGQPVRRAPQAQAPAGSSSSGRRTSGGSASLAETPFPQIRGERLERLFFSAPEHNPKTCTVCYRRKHSKSPHRHTRAKRPSNHHHHAHSEEEDEGFAESSDEGDDDDHERGGRGRNELRRGGREDLVDKLLNDTLHNVPSDADYFKKVAGRAGLPPQTVAMRVIRELEDDFTHYKSVYCELADQYKEMNPVSDVPRRNMLAKHLREVVDVLEQKGDQIASLSDLLAFKDKTMSGGRK